MGLFDLMKNAESSEEDAATRMIDAREAWLDSVSVIRELQEKDQRARIPSWVLDEAEVLGDAFSEAEKAWECAEKKRRDATLAWLATV